MNTTILSFAFDFPEELFPSTWGNEYSKAGIGNALAPTWMDVWGNISDIAIAILTLLTLLGLALVYSQLRTQQKHLHRDFENMFIERYWVIQDRVVATEPGTPERRLADLAYLELSNDQCEMRMNARVTDDTWEIWRSAIVAALQNQEFQSLLEQEPTSRFRQLRFLLEEGSKYESETYDETHWRRLGV